MEENKNTEKNHSLSFESLDILIAKWKDGKFPSAEILFRVALFLGVSMDEIMWATYGKGVTE